MDWILKIARHCRELMVHAQSTPIVEQLQIWAEELEGENRQVLPGDTVDQGGFVGEATSTVR